MGEMVLLITAISVLGLGHFLKEWIEKSIETRRIRKYYKLRKERFDEKVNNNNSNIDNSPIKDLLKPGEYLRGEQD